MLVHELKVYLMYGLSLLLNLLRLSSRLLEGLIQFLILFLSFSCQILLYLFRFFYFLLVLALDLGQLCHHFR